MPEPGFFGRRPLFKLKGVVVLRGIEGALFVLGKVREGKFASEALRSAGSGMKPADLSLASSLVYIVLRRTELWRTVYEGFMKGGRNKSAGRDGRTVKDPSSLPQIVRDCLLVGTAGQLELRRFAKGVLVNALLDHLKSNGMKGWVSLVNAVLHSVGERGAERLERIRKSASADERAMWAGVPVWSVPAWVRSWQRADLNALFDIMHRQPMSSLRAAPGRKEELLSLLEERGIEASASDASDAVHLRSTVMPREVPGFDDGLCTVQNEGSIMAASIVKKFYKGGLILDMCSGRGVKAGQILQECLDARLECWELSEGRHKNAEAEMKRLGVGGRAVMRCGDALELEPSERPSLVLLDAPCSGSGTWNSKPDAKWRLNWAELDRITGTQRKLLRRAFELCAPGGVILYITCSLLRQENEEAVADAMADRPGCAALSVPLDGEAVRRGRPWGAYIWPATPWLDGFYCAAVRLNSVDGGRVYGQRG